MNDRAPDRWGAPLHERVLDAAGVVSGTAVLDLGCGRGSFARAAADRGARITGVDGDRAAVAAAAEAVPQGRFTVGDVHDPPSGPFDVAAGVQLLEHVTNPLKVLRAAGSVADVLAVTVWGREQECQMRVFREALAPWLPPRPVPSGPPPVTEPDRLRKLVSLAGLDETALDEVVCPFDYPDDEAVLAPLLGSSIGRHAAARAGEAAVRDAVLAQLAEHRTTDGGYVLHNVFRVLTACSGK